MPVPADPLVAALPTSPQAQVNQQANIATPNAGATNAPQMPLQAPQTGASGIPDIGQGTATLEAQAGVQQQEPPDTLPGNYFDKPTPGDQGPPDTLPGDYFNRPNQAPQADMSKLVPSLTKLYGGTPEITVSPERAYDLVKQADNASKRGLEKDTTLTMLARGLKDTKSSGDYFGPALDPHNVSASQYAKLNLDPETLSKISAKADCSLFTQRWYATKGVSIPRTAIQQYNATPRVLGKGQIDESRLQPGDLVFFDNGKRTPFNTEGKAVTIPGTASGGAIKTGYVNHVGIYAGEGMIAHDPGNGTYKTVPLSHFKGMTFMGASRPKPGVLQQQESGGSASMFGNIDELAQAQGQAQQSMREVKTLGGKDIFNPTQKLGPPQPINTMGYTSGELAQGKQQQANRGLDILQNDPSIRNRVQELNPGIEGPHPDPDSSYNALNALAERTTLFMQSGGMSELPSYPGQVAKAPSTVEFAGLNPNNSLVRSGQAASDTMLSFANPINWATFPINVASDPVGAIGGSIEQARNAMPLIGKIAKYVVGAGIPDKEWNGAINRARIALGGDEKEPTIEEQTAGVINTGALLWMLHGIAHGHIENAIAKKEAMRVLDSAIGAADKNGGKLNFGPKSTFEFQPTEIEGVGARRIFAKPGAEKPIGAGFHPTITKEDLINAKAILEGSKDTADQSMAKFGPRSGPPVSEPLAEGQQPNAQQPGISFADTSRPGQPNLATLPLGDRWVTKTPKGETPQMGPTQGLVDAQGRPLQGSGKTPFAGVLGPNGEPVGPKPPSGTLNVFRHGETDLNSTTPGKEMTRGWADNPKTQLTDNGRMQAAFSSTQVPQGELGHTVSSPLNRAMEHGRIAVGIHEQGLLDATDPDLGPLKLGKFTGMLADEAAKALKPYLEKPDKQIPAGSGYEGESVNDFLKRQKNAWEKYVARVKNGEHVSVFTHYRNFKVWQALADAGGDITKVNVKELFKPDTETPPGSVLRITPQADGSFKSQLITDHLPKSPNTEPAQIARGVKVKDTGPGTGQPIPGSTVGDQIIPGEAGKPSPQPDTTAPKLGTAPANVPPPRNVTVLHPVASRIAGLLAESLNVPRRPSAEELPGGTIHAGIDPSLFHGFRASIYRGAIDKISIKEMLQNSVDAGLRGMGGKGRVKVDYDSGNKSFTVEDNGHGMTPDVVKNQFVDLGSSFKKGKTTGGFGIAKAAFLYNSEKFELSTVADDAGGRVRTVFTGSGEQLFNGTNPAPTIENVPSGTPTGTSLKIKLIDDVYTSPYSTSDLLQSFQDNHKLPIETDFTVDGRKIVAGGGWKGEGWETHQIGKAHVGDQDAGVDLTYNAPDTLTRKSSLPVYILSHGLPQTSIDIQVPDSVSTPAKLVVDVSPSESVKPTDQDYPWTLNRENLSEKLTSEIQHYVNYDLVGDLHQQEKNLYSESLTGGPRLGKTIARVGENETAPLRFVDATASLPKDVTDAVGNTPIMHELADTINYVYRRINERLGQLDPNYSTGYFHGLMHSGKERPAFGMNIPSEWGGPGVSRNAVLIDPGTHISWIDQSAPYGAMDLPGTPEEKFASSVIATLVHEATHEIDRSESFSGPHTRANAAMSAISRQLENEIVEVLTRNRGDGLSQLRNLYDEIKYQDKGADSLLNKIGTSADDATQGSSQPTGGSEAQGLRSSGDLPGSSGDAVPSREAAADPRGPWARYNWDALKKMGQVIHDDVSADPNEWAKSFRDHADAAGIKSDDFASKIEPNLQRIWDELDRGKDNATLQTKQIEGPGAQDVRPGEPGQTTEGRSTGESQGNKELQKPTEQGKEEEVVRTAHASMREVRERLNMDALPPRARQPVLEAYQKAIDSNAAANALKIANDVLSNPRPMTMAEEASIGLRTIQIAKLIEELPKDDPRVNVFRDEFHTIHDASELAGSEWGRTGVARQVELIDYGPEGVRYRLEHANEKVPLGEGGSGIKDIQAIAKSERISEIDKTLVEKDANAAKLGAAKELDRLTREFKKSPTGKLEQLKQEREELWSQFRQKSSGSFAGLNPDALVTLGKILVNKIKEGAINLGQLVDWVNGELKDRGGDPLEDRDVYDALTYKPEAKPPTPEAKRVSDLKAQAGLISKINDTISGVYPEGAQKAEASNIVKGLRKTLAEINKIQGRDPNRLDTLKKALAKSVDELEVGPEDKWPKRPDTPEEARIRSEIEKNRKLANIGHGASDSSRLASERLKNLESKLQEVKNQNDKNYRPIKRRVAPSTPEIDAVKEQIKQALAKQKHMDDISDMQEQLRTDQFEERPPKPKPDPEIAKLMAEKKQLRKEIDDRIAARQPKTIGTRIANFVRTSMLSGVGSLANLSAAVFHHFITNPAENLVFGPIVDHTVGRIKGRSGETLHQAAGTELQWNIDAESKSAAQFINPDTYKAAWAKIRNKELPEKPGAIIPWNIGGAARDIGIDAAPSRSGVNGLLQAELRVHDAFKTPTERAAWVSEWLKQLQQAQDRGQDPMDPDVRHQAFYEAYNQAMRGKLLNDSAGTKVLAGMLRPMGATGKVLVPFSRVPVNLAGRTLEYTPVGTAKTILYDLPKWIMSKEKNPELARSIARSLKRGGLGAALFTWAANTDDVKTDDNGDLYLWGHKLPAFASHLPILETVAMGHYYKLDVKHGGFAGAMLSSNLRGIKDVATHAPFFDVPKEAVDAMGGMSKGEHLAPAMEKAAAKMTVNRLVPPTVQQVAKGKIVSGYDLPGGNIIGLQADPSMVYRKTDNAWDEAKAALPWARQTLHKAIRPKANIR